MTGGTPPRGPRVPGGVHTGSGRGCSRTKTVRCLPPSRNGLGRGNWPPYDVGDHRGPRRRLYSVGSRQSCPPRIATRPDALPHSARRFLRRTTRRKTLKCSRPKGRGGARRWAAIRTKRGLWTRLSRGTGYKGGPPSSTAGAVGPGVRETNSAWRRGNGVSASPAKCSTPSRRKGNDQTAARKRGCTECEKAPGQNFQAHGEEVLALAVAKFRRWNEGGRRKRLPCRCHIGRSASGGIAARTRRLIEAMRAESVGRAHHSRMGQRELSHRPPSTGAAVRRDGWARVRQGRGSGTVSRDPCISAVEANRLHGCGPRVGEGEVRWVKNASGRRRAVAAARSRRVAGCFSVRGGQLLGKKSRDSTPMRRSDGFSSPQPVSASSPEEGRGLRGRFGKRARAGVCISRFDHSAAISRG